MSRTRLTIAAALLALAAFVGVRTLLRPEPYVTLARDAAVPAAPEPAAPSDAPGGPAAPSDPAAAPGGPAASRAAAADGLPAAGREPPSAARLHAVLAALDRARAAGYAAPVAAEPDSWAARSCACHAVDARRLRALAAAGRTLRGHRATVTRLVVVRAGPARAVLIVTDRTGPYAAVDPAGRVVARWPASGPRRWRVTLVRAGGRWLLGSVARAP